MGYFPDGPMTKNMPSNVGDTSSILRCFGAHTPQWRAMYHKERSHTLDSDLMQPNKLIKSLRKRIIGKGSQGALWKDITENLNTWGDIS